MVEKWEKVGSERLADYRIFKSRADVRRSPRTGAEHTFFVLESPDWMNVIPLTADGKVVFVHQFRHGSETVTMEIPGGLVEADESPAETARRELLEETGYAADDMILIGAVLPNPAFMNNACYSFLATNARKVQAQQLDGTEDISVEETPLAEVAGLIRNGRITHSLVVAAFYHLERYFETVADNPNGRQRGNQ